LQQQVDALEQALVSLGDDEMQRKHGFTFQNYIDDRKEVRNHLENVANDLEQKIKDCGIAKAIGGGTGVLSGCCAVAGILAAPFSGGLSIGLTVGGLATGVGSGITSLTAETIKSCGIESTSKDVDEKIKARQTQTKIIEDLLTDVETQHDQVFKSIEQLGDEQCALDDLERIIGSLRERGGFAAYATYNLIDGARTARGIYKTANFLGNEVSFASTFVKSCAEGFSAPAWEVGGKTVARAGGKTAKCLGVIGGAVSVGFGVQELLEGIKDTEGGNEVVNKIRERREFFDEQTTEMEKMVNDVRATIGQH
jgi:hypothetical protein